MSRVDLTIITVCYNDAGLLEQTIANIAAIKREGIAYLVIDGGSNDGTRELVERHGHVVDSWVSEPDMGIYDAMNKGWGMADSHSRVLFLGAGDKIISLPDSLDNYGAGEIVYGDVMVGGRRFHSVADYRLRFSNTLHHQALLVPRTLHPNPPFDTRFRVYADYDFNLRLMGMGAHFTYVSEMVGYAEPGGISADKRHVENFKVVRHNLGLVGALLSTAFLTVRKLLECVGIHGLTP